MWAITKELKRFLRAPQASGFLLVDRQLQVAHQPFDRRQHPCRRGLAENAKVIGVVHDFRTESPYAEIVELRRERPVLSIRRNAIRRDNISRHKLPGKRPMKAAVWNDAASLDVVEVAQPDLNLSYCSPISFMATATSPGHASLQQHEWVKPGTTITWFRPVSVIRPR